MDSAGDFAVAWTSYGEDGSMSGIYAQRYNPSGNPLGSEFRVNVTTADNQFRPAIAMDAAGDFVIAWDSYGQDGAGFGVYARRYDAGGVAQGGEFRVNATTARDQIAPAVAMDAAGDFTIAWQSHYQDGSSDGIYAQRYDAAGNARGSEFRANTTTINFQIQAAVAMGPAGDSVIAWASNQQDGSLGGIYAQRYDAAGNASGPEFRVNTTTANNQVGQPSRWTRRVSSP